MNRRAILLSTLTSLGFSGCLSAQTESQTCDVACVAFDHEGFDDARDWLTVRHTGGRDLPADEVFITGTAEEWPGPAGGETKPWFELDDDVGPTDGIAGEDVRVDLAQVSTVRVLWRRNETERVIGEWTYESPDVDI